MSDPLDELKIPDPNALAAARIKPRQLRMIRALLVSKSVQAALEETRVSKTVFYSKWMRDPLFLRALEEERKSFFASNRSTIEGAFAKAIDVLVALLDSNSEEQRRMAAGQVIANVLRLREIDVSEKVDELIIRLEALQ